MLSYPPCPPCLSRSHHLLTSYTPHTSHTLPSSPPLWVSDRFLVGANVERLAKMINKQAPQAQFIEVSLLRPIVESSERTTVVTRARGAYTQVLRIKL